MVLRLYTAAAVPIIHYGSEMQGIKGTLFREPRQGVFYWVVMLFGCADLAYGLLFSSSTQARPLLLVIGLMIFLVGAAEILPRSRATLAGLLRIGGLVAALLAVILVIRDLLSHLSS